MHLVVSTHWLCEVEVDILVVLMASQDTDRQLEDSRPVLAVRHQVHHGVEERQARVLQRQTEVALGIVHSHRAEPVLNFEGDGEEV